MFIKLKYVLKQMENKDFNATIMFNVIGFLFKFYNYEAIKKELFRIFTTKLDGPHSVPNNFLEFMSLK